MPLKIASGGTYQPASPPLPALRPGLPVGDGGPACACPHTHSVTLRVNQSRRKLYVTDVSGRLWAFNRSTGRVLWRQMQLQGRGASAPALFRGEVVVGDAGGFLYAFNRSSGALQAMTRVTKAPMISKPLVFADLLIVSCQNGRVKAYHLRQV